MGCDQHQMQLMWPNSKTNKDLILKAM